MEMIMGLLKNPFFMGFVQVTVFTIMLGMGLHLSLKALVSLWGMPGLMVRSLLAVVVLVPLALMGLGPLLIRLGITAGAGMALVVLAACPGAPLLTTRAATAGGDIVYASGIQLSSSVLAIVATPVVLFSLSLPYPETHQTIQALAVAKVVAYVQLLPIGIGLFIRHLKESLAGTLARWVAMLSRIFLLVLVLILLVASFGLILAINWADILSILMFAAAALAIGHFTGAAEPALRSALAVGCIARNIGLALVITSINMQMGSVVPFLIAFMILGSVVAIPYSVWMKKRVASGKAVPPPCGEKQMK